MVKMESLELTEYNKFSVTHKLLQIMAGGKDCCSPFLQVPRFGARAMAQQANLPHSDIGVPYGYQF